MAMLLKSVIYSFGQTLQSIYKAKRIKRIFHIALWSRELFFDAKLFTRYEDTSAVTLGELQIDNCLN